MSDKSVAKKPCRECPFLKKSMPGWLGGGEHQLAPDYVRLAHSEANVPCHMSKGVLDGTDVNVRPCAGLAQFRNHVMKSPRGGPARAACDATPNSNPDVFASDAEFLKHHDTELNRQFGEIRKL